jgi:hypothetical protein
MLRQAIQVLQVLATGRNSFALNGTAYRPAGLISQPPEDHVQDRVFQGPRQFPLKQFRAETAVPYPQFPGLSVSVPDAGAQRYNITAAQWLGSLASVMHCLAGDDQSNLYKIVVMRGYVNVMAGEQHMNRKAAGK